MKKKRAIVLSGGGARGAYQVGVLKALSEIAQKHHIDPKVTIYTGISAGAINAICMASHADDFHFGVAKLVRLWSGITSDQVFASNMAQMGKIAAKWVSELSLGAIIGTRGGKAFLNTDPLRRLVSSNVDFRNIEKNINNGSLGGVAITATDYESSNSVTFVHANDSVKAWRKTRRISEKSQLTVEHIMASSAIPLLFPAIKVGNRYFGDGSVRNNSPCAPSIYMGADHLLVIGVRLWTTATEEEQAQPARPPSLGKVINELLNAILLDGIEMDVERLNRVNDFVAQVPSEYREDLSYHSVDVDFISPSMDFGDLAFEHSASLPFVIRYLLKGLGRLEDSKEILSYLLFDPGFCQALLDVGYKDGLAAEKKLLRFLMSSYEEESEDV